MSPIRPENKALYPSNWKEIRAEILQRATVSNPRRYDQPTFDRPACECIGQCGTHSGHCAAMDGFMHYGPMEATVVLTVAHMDHDPANNGEPGDRPNLCAMCQPCHNAYDAPVRAANRRRRLNREAGQLELEMEVG